MPTRQATRKPGRPALDENSATIPVTVRLTEAQKEKLARLGGGKWVRAKVDAAREPPEQDAPQVD